MLPLKKFEHVLAVRPSTVSRPTTYSGGISGYDDSQRNLRLVFVPWNVIAHFHRPIAVVVVLVVAVSEGRARYELKRCVNAACVVTDTA